MIFKCKYTNGKRTETWTGKIILFEKFGTHYELRIESRSSITVIFGKTTNGGFACMPDSKAGCYLVSLDDEFWNTEKLINVLGPVDGITVASALSKIADEIDF